MIYTERNVNKGDNCLTKRGCTIFRQQWPRARKINVIIFPDSSISVLFQSELLVSHNCMSDYFSVALFSSVMFMLIILQTVSQIQKFWCMFLTFVFHRLLKHVLFSTLFRFLNLVRFLQMMEL